MSPAPLAGTIQFSCGQTWRLIGTSGVQNELQGCWYHTPNGEQLSDCRRFSLSPGERAGVRASVFSTAPFRLRVKGTRRRAQSRFRFLVISTFMVLQFFKAGSQTHTDAPSLLMFSIPAVTLRAPPSSPTLEESQPSSSPIPQAFESQRLAVGSLTNSVTTGTQDTFSGEVSSDNFSSDFERRLFSRIEKGGYLGQRRPAPVKVLDKIVDNIFEPEIIHAGKTTVSCSLVTAIRRKNPLCLINPVFFQWCW